MAKQLITLEQITIPNPCTNNWEQMIGNDQIRFCNQCSSQVFDLSKMTKKQVEGLVTEKQGNLCARIIRRADGTIQTIDNSTNKVSRIQPILKAASATIFVLISFSALANAQTQLKTTLPIIVSLPDKSTEHLEPSAQIYGPIYDSSRAVMAGADITLTNETTGEIHQTISNEEGNYYIYSLVPGLYTIEVVSTGFEHFQRKSIALAPNNHLYFEAVLAIAPTSEVIQIEGKNEVITVSSGGICIREKPRKRLLTKFIASYKNFKKLFSHGTK